MSKYIQNLILRGEHQQQDFKFQVNDARKIARTLVAFANTDGGKLLIGVKDNGVIAGVRTEEEYHMIESAAELYCKPEIDFAFRSWNIDGKKILEIDVPKANVRPFYALSEDDRWMAYVRVKDENILAAPVQLKYWKRLQQPQGTIIKYSQNEEILLKFLSENPSITIDKYCHFAGIPKYLAENTIVNLMVAGLVEMTQDEHNLWFRSSCLNE
ncbi:MAG: ATP-binding protein [Bacteroidetes bacterium]|nr:ATP-binding protein [Bacteroidota bacterium]